MSRLERPARRLVVAVAAVGAVWSLLPAGVWWAGWPASYYATSWQVWRWGGLVVVLAAALLLILSRGRAADVLARAWSRLEAVPARRFITVAAVLLGLLTLLASLVLFSGNPRNVDGFAQLFQARIFLAGRLWIPPPPPPELANFATLQMIVGPERWYAQYPPGQSLVLAAGLAAGAWWLLHPLLAAALAAATWRVARWACDETTARLAAMLLCASPFVLAVAGSEMSHLGTAALALGAAACATATDGPRSKLAAAGAGALLGLMTAFRPLDAVAAAVPVAGILLLAARRPLATLAIAAFAGAAATVPTLAYNAATTGDWLLFGYVRLWGPEHALGFHDVPWGVPLTPRRAVGLTGLDLHQLNIYLLDLPLPALAVAALGLVLGRSKLGARDAVPALGAAALFGLLFFYWHRDVFYGPRLHFSAVPWIVMLVARGAVQLTRIERPVILDRPAGASLGTLLAVAAAVGLVALLPPRLRAYRESAPLFSLHPDRDADRAGIGRAVVVIPDGWGSRLITRMWALGIPVWRTTRLYAGIDACTLEQAIGRAEADSVARERLPRTLDSLFARRRPGVRGGLTEDPNLRLPDPRPNPSADVRLPTDSILPEACRAELAFDRRGFLAFAPFLYLNTARLDGDIVWARDMGPRNAALFARYAGRRRFRYAPLVPGGPPVFTSLETADEAR